MKTKTLFFTTMVFVFLMICPTGINAQTATSKLDQFKLAQQGLGTWEANIDKDTIQVWEVKQYGKSFIGNVYNIVKGQKSPDYINNYCIDAKDGKLKGFLLSSKGYYVTWIGSYITEKKVSADMFQNFNSDSGYLKVEISYDTPTSFIITQFNTAGVKTLERKYKKIK